MLKLERNRLTQSTLRVSDVGRKGARAQLPASTESMNPASLAALLSGLGSTCVKLLFLGTAFQFLLLTNRAVTFDMA